MKKDKKALILGLIGAAAGVVALVAWIVVVAIMTGFYSTRINLCTTEEYTVFDADEASKIYEEGYQGWTDFLSVTVSSEYDKFFTKEDGDYISQSKGVTSNNYSNYVNVTPTTITRAQRKNGTVEFNSNTNYYEFKSQNYYKIDMNADIFTSDTYGNIFTLVESTTTRAPKTTISFTPSTTKFAPSAYEGVEFVITFYFGLVDTSIDRTTLADTEKKTINISVDKKGYGSAETTAFNLQSSASFTNIYFNVDSVSGSVVKK